MNGSIERSVLNRNASLDVYAENFIRNWVGGKELQTRHVNLQENQVVDDGGDGVRRGMYVASIGLCLGSI